MGSDAVSIRIELGAGHSGRELRGKKSILVLELKSESYIAIEILSSVQSFSHVRLFVTLWTEARQATLPITNCRNLFRLMSIEFVIPSNHLILCCPLLLLPSIVPSIRVFIV